MKIAKKLLYFALTFTTIMVLRSLDQDSANLDIKSWDDELCAEFGTGGERSDLATQSEREDANTLLTNLEYDGLHDFVYKLLNTREVSSSELSDVMPKLMPLIVPWAIFLAISLFGWMFYCSYCCCDKKCPPANCCKRDYKDKPLSNKELLIPVGIAILLNVFIFSAAIAGISYAGGIGKGIRATRCSFMGVFYDIMYETSGNNFPGLTGIVSKIDTVVADLNTFQTGLVDLFSSEKSKKYKTDQLAIIALNNAQKRGQSGSPLPALTTSNGAGSIPSTESYLSSQFVFDYILASSSDANYATVSSSYGQLDNTNYKSMLPATSQPELLNVYYDTLVEITSNIEENSKPVKDASLSSTLKSGQDSAKSLITQVEDAASSIYDFTNPMGDYADIITTIMEALFGLLIGLSLIAIVSILLMQFLKLYKLRGLVHIVWSLYIIIMILGFLLGLILHPTATILIEFCNYFEEFTTDPIFFASSTLIDNKDTKDLLGECFFGEGNAFKQLGLANSMDDLKGLTDSTTAFTTRINTMKSDGTVTTVNTKMSNNVLCLTNSKDGTVIDLKPSDYSTYSGIISSFNGVSGPGCVELQSVQCSGSGNGAAGAATRAGASTVTTCWHPSYLVTQSSSCAGQAADLSKLKAHYQAQQSTWTASEAKEKSINDAHLALNKDFWSYIDQIDAFLIQSNTIIDAIANPVTGLLGGLNCLFLKGTFSRIIDGMCVLFIPSIYRTTILILMVSVGMFFGSLANCCVGLRFYRINEYGFAGDNKVHQARPDETEMERITKG